jgi:hypothetical protein
MKEDKNNLATRTQRRYGEEARAEMTAPACEADGGTGLAMGVERTQGSGAVMKCSAGG